MPTRILLAGAAGAVGRRLVPLLVDAGYAVFGTTRSPDKEALLRRLGAEPLRLDVFDPAALGRAFAAARPEIVLHQLTDLPPGLPPALMSAAVAANARLRTEGTRNLVDAAFRAGARHVVAQSIAWAYAPGPLPHEEADPLDLGAAGDRGVTVAGVAALERAVLETPGLRGAVLRYGALYGPGTGFDAPRGPMPLHVDAAAFAALCAAQRSATGAFNLAEPNAAVATARAAAALGWQATFRLPA
jgi:nucleoside-diphosphate-sugar epimerase